MLHRDKQCVLGQGTVIDPAVLLQEIDELRARGLLDRQRFADLGARAPDAAAPHARRRAARAAARARIGTTKRGIGPAYEDKVARRGVRMGDLLIAREVRAQAGGEPRGLGAGDRRARRRARPTSRDVVERYMELGRELAPLSATRARAVRHALRAGKRVLFEGAQGTLLDVDSRHLSVRHQLEHGRRRRVHGRGHRPDRNRRVIGITKAYATRVGDGPFPTELHGDGGRALREAGDEFGAVTGRPRRCGWLDLPALRYAARVNGLHGSR